MDFEKNVKWAERSCHYPIFYIEKLSTIRKKVEFMISSMSRAGIIKYIKENPQKDIFPRDIVKRFCLTRSTVAGILQKMEQNGYIEMQSYPGDARLKKIVLTEKGDEASDLVKEQTVEWNGCW